MRSLKFIIHFIFFLLPTAWGTDPIIYVPVLGKILGTTLKSIPELDGISREYLEFRAIPYAAVPDRFSPSELLEKELGDGDVFNATVHGPRCYQSGVAEAELSEDCLHLTISTGKAYAENDSDLRPVLLYIHGGAFTRGSGHSYTAQRILNRDVVHISLNYRLGLMGFFSLQNEAVPGNAGLYDIITALKWTKAYIQYFGGDSNRITVVGHSAGAVMVTCLITSPLAKGLFQNAISISGSAFNHWGTGVDVMHHSLKIANISACYNYEIDVNVTQIAACMRSLPAYKLLDVLSEYHMSEEYSRLAGPMAPTVQDFRMPNVPKVMPTHPRDIFQNGEQSPVPLLMGTTRHEGSYTLAIFYNTYLRGTGLETNASFLKTKLTSMVLDSLDIHDIPFGVHHAIQKSYLGNAATSGNFMSMVPGLADICSALSFKGDAYYSALLHSKIAPTYWYSFDFIGNSTTMEGAIGGEAPPFFGGVTHADDLIYTYLRTTEPFSTSEHAVSSRVLEYWANFAGSGNPDVGWPLLSFETQEYMSINLERIVLKNFTDTFIGPGLELVADTAPETNQSTPSQSKCWINPFLMMIAMLSNHVMSMSI